MTPRSQHFPSSPSSRELHVPRLPRRVVVAPRLWEFKEHLDDSLEPRGLVLGSPERSREMDPQGSLPNRSSLWL